MHEYYWGWGSWIIGFTFLVMLIWVIVKLTINSSASMPRNNALDILKERYARGEIKKEEYLEKKNDLLKD